MPSTAAAVSDGVMWSVACDPVQEKVAQQLQCHQPNPDALSD